MQKLVKVKWFKSSRDLSEIYQPTGMVFAFVSSPAEGSSVCHEWVKCRDFLHDAVRSQITDKKCGIYGFSFEPGVNPKLDLKRIRMAVSKHGLKPDNINDFRNKMKASLTLLNHFEKQENMMLSKLQEIDSTNSGKSAVFLFTGSSIWMSSPFLVSMYSFLIRLGDKELKFENKDELIQLLKALSDDAKAGKISDNDAVYLGASWDKLHIILKNRIKLFKRENGVHDIYFSKYDISRFHNYCGIRSLASLQTPDEDLNSRMKSIIK